MNYSIPEDIVNALKREFSDDIPIKRILHKFFELLLNKTIKDGETPIRQFGKFKCFSVISSKTGKEVVRFKFQISHTLTKLMQNDEYIINQLPEECRIKPSMVFGESNREKCKDKQDIKKINLDISKNTSRIGKEKTAKNIVRDVVSAIIEGERKEKILKGD